MSVYERVHAHAPPALSEEAEDDDWETDPEPANTISEKEQRWGAATLPDDSKGKSDMASLRENVRSQHEQASTVEYLSKKREVGDSYGQGRLKN
jgi:hypothetical protein